jgi:CheY-like chemotaxis protein
MSAPPNVHVSVDSVEDSKMTGRKLILSVDDEPGILRSRKLILEAAGYDVLNASSGAQALGIFSTVLVDLVVLDYAMPGVNGGE